MLFRPPYVAVFAPGAPPPVRFYPPRPGIAGAGEASWEPGVDLADTVLGLEGTAGRQVLLKIGNAYLELFEFRSPAGRAADPDRRVCDHGYTHLCIDVDDLDSTYERLLSAGVRFTSPPQDLLPGVRTCYSRDPDGNVVEIQQLSPRHPFSAARAAVDHDHRPSDVGGRV